MSVFEQIVKTRHIPHWLFDKGTRVVEVLNSLFLIGLDRAAKRNAFDSHMIHDLSLALTEYEDDPSLRCAVIFAHGEHFTAGLDLVELQPKLTAGVFDFPVSQINP